MFSVLHPESSGLYLSCTPPHPARLPGSVCLIQPARIMSESQPDSETTTTPVDETTTLVDETTTLVDETTTSLDETTASPDVTEPSTSPTDSPGLLIDPVSGYWSSLNRGPITKPFTPPTSCVATLTLSADDDYLYFGHNYASYVDPACYPAGTAEPTNIISSEPWNNYYCKNFSSYFSI